MAALLIDPFSRFFAYTGTLSTLSGGYMETKDAGLDTDKATQTTALGDVDLPNPIMIDSDGDTIDGSGNKTAVFGTGNYKLKLYDSDGLLKKEVDNVQGTEVTKQLATISELRAEECGGSDYIQVSGYYEDGDGGGGNFYWDPASSLSDNGGTVIIPNSAPATGRWIRIYNGSIHIKMFGASPDLTDNTTYIQNAINAGENTYVDEGTYDFGSQINVSTKKRFHGPGKLNFTGSGEHAVVFGNAGVNNVWESFEQNNIWLTRDTPGIDEDWTDQFAGVQFLNCFQINANVYCDGFYYGMLLEGNTKGCAYSQYYIDRIKDCVSAVHLRATDSDGYVNQNTFFGGRISMSSAASSSKDFYGFTFERTNGGGRLNANQCFNTSIELHNLGSGFTSCMHGMTGDSETSIAIGNWMNFRYEATDYVVSGIGMLNNNFELARGNPSATVISQLINGDTALDTTEMILNRFMGPTTTWPMYHDLHVCKGGFTKRQLVEVEQSAGTNRQVAPARGAFWVQTNKDFAKRRNEFTFSENSFQCTSPSVVVGMLFDLAEEANDYLRRIDVKILTASAGGRIIVVPFDSSNNRLIGDGSPGAGEALDAAACTLDWNVGDSMWKQGNDLSDSRSEASIGFSDNVTKVFIGVAGGTADADIVGIDYYGYGQADITLFLNTEIMDTFSSNSITCEMMDTDDPVSQGMPPIDPTGTNTYNEGTFVRNVDPENYQLAADNDSPYGWIYNGSEWMTCYKAEITSNIYNILKEDIDCSSAAAAFNLSSDLPDGSALVSAQINLKTAITGAGGCTAVGLGIAANLNKYGETTGLTQNLKIDTVPDWAVLSGAEDVQLYATDGAGVATGTMGGSGEEITVALTYVLPTSLPDA